MQLTLVSVHCCELCALKQKPGVLLEKPISPSRPKSNLCSLCETTKITKSQLQTVLITASGPQALNALVHRERYTQGSRQNRCVSSQKALALRAKAVWNRGDKCRQVPGATFGLYGVSALCTLRASGSSCPEATVSGGGHPPLLPQHGLGGDGLHGLSPSSQKLPTRNCLRRRIQLYN